MNGYGESLADAACSAGRFADEEAQAQLYSEAKQKFFADERMKAIADHQGITMKELWRAMQDDYMDAMWEVA